MAGVKLLSDAVQPACILILAETHKHGFHVFLVCLCQGV